MTGTEQTGRKLVGPHLASCIPPNRNSVWPHLVVTRVALWIRG